MKRIPALVLCVGSVLSTGAGAIDSLFEKLTPDSLHGVIQARDPTYLKECGSCHFAYSPGMLPARSWTRMMGRLDRHFGETVGLEAAANGAILRYLVDNAADRSPYEGSKVLMESLEDNVTPGRIQSVPHIRSVHRVIREVIARNYHVKVRTLVNCDGCHQRAVEGDFSLGDLRVEGLHGLQLIRPGKAAAR